MAKKPEIKEKITKGKNAPNVRKEILNQNPDTGDIKSKWWLGDQDKAHRNVQAVVAAIEENQNFRRIQNLRYARLYANREIIGFGATTFDRPLSKDAITNRVTYNVVKATTDTASSKIGKSKPRPLVLTSGGDFSEQQKGKKLSKYLEGVFDVANTYEIGQRVFVDACVFGTGAMKVFFDFDKGEPVTERVFIDEIIVDDAEGIHGNPRQLHQRKIISRDVLIDMFPESADKIMRADPADNSHRGTSSSSADQIEVIESWHLPSGQSAGDGRHVISIDNTTLLSEEYKKDYFPFVFFRWSPSLLGFFGTGIAEELIGLQIEINKLLRNIQQAQNLAAVPRVFVESSSNVVSEHITNEIGSIIKYVGNAPVISPSPAMSSEVYAHLETLYARAFEIVGISQLSASSRKPTGLNSGVAIRESQDIESERFALVAQRYEKMFIDTAKHIIDVSRDVYEQLPDLSIKVKGKEFIETIKWKDVDLEDDKFSLRVFPTSLLPKTPAGRLQTVQELVQSGFIGKKEALSLLDFPDLEHVINLENAAIDDVNRIMEILVDEGRYIAPEPFMDLQLSLKISQNTYLQSKVKNVPEDRLDLIRRFMEDVIALQQAAQPEPVPQVAPVTAEEDAAIAAAEAVPTTDLLPFEQN